MRKLPCLLCFAAFPALATELREGELASDLIPKPVPYSVLLPDGYQADGDPLPLLLLLHGGGGDRKYLASMRPSIEELWRTGKFARMVVATPSVGSRCFYMDYRDGSEKWESFLIGPFRKHLQQTYNTSADPKKNLVMGISMGGMGTLRMGFKHPELFGGLAAMEPGIEPILHWKDIQPKHRFWRDDSLFEAAFGKPVDPAYWEANNPASIAQANPAKISASGLQIYLDCGDEDMFLLFEGSEFLHRVLYDAGIKHEYHLVRGADHLGRTVRPRSQEALQFLTRALNPPPAVDPAAEPMRKALAPSKAKAGVK